MPVRHQYYEDTLVESADILGSLMDIGWMEEWMIVVMQHWLLCLGLPAAFCESVKLLVVMDWLWIGNGLVMD